MPIYRSDQSRLSFASEAGLGGYLDYISAITDAADWTGLVNMAAGLPAGSRSVIFDGGSGSLVVLNYLQLGTTALGDAEVRRVTGVPPTGTHNGGAGAASLTDTTKNFAALGVVVGDTLQNFTTAETTTITAITTTTNTSDTLVGVLSGAGTWAIGNTYRLTSGTIWLDQPTGFAHANNDTLDEKSSTLNSLAGTSLVTFLPGVYENVTVPDMAPQIEPRYFLGTAAKRNWTNVYRGRQTFSGSLPNFMLLNSYPLRFPIGRVRTVASAVTAVSTTTTAATLKGQRSLPVTDGTPAAVAFANGDYIEIERSGTNPEVRQIISGGGVNGATTFILNYPMMFAHANPVTVSVVDLAGSYFYTHTIVEDVALDSISWHLQMRDSDETVLNDFLRRYIGGKINRASLRADEGGMLMMSWDEVPFIDLIHNQQFHSSVGSGSTDITKFAGAMIAPAGVGGACPWVTPTTLGTPTYPTNDPYYFSQSSISFFGIEFARIRSFSLEINNNIEPRYYLKDTSSGRIPAELQEQRREYRMTARVALPDSMLATATTRTLFKELLLEGNYGSGMAGFDMSLIFTRGSNDTITITIPPSSATTGIDAEGAFIVRGANNIGGESPTEVDLEIIFRSMSLVAVDSDGVMP